MMSVPNDLSAPTPESIAAYVKRHSARAKKLLGAMHDHSPAETVREADYKGHHIVIGTTYRIEVDGRRVGGHFVVTDDGQVQCHALPNYTFSSAVDLVKSMIEIFPEDFSDTHDHGGHDHEGKDHEPHRAATKPVGKRRTLAGKSAPARRARKGKSEGRRHGRQ